MYDLILGCKAMKELEIVLEFWTKDKTIDEIILPMRDINSPTMSKLESTWTVNNSMAQDQQRTHEATQQVIHILDAKYEKANLQSVFSTNCTHLSLWDQNKLLE